MLKTIIGFVAGKAGRALAFKLLMVYLVPWLFDQLIKVLEYLSKKTATRLDDGAVDIQKDAKDRYMKIIEEEFK